MTVSQTAYQAKQVVIRLIQRVAAFLGLKNISENLQSPFFCRIFALKSNKRKESSVIYGFVEPSETTSGLYDFVLSRLGADGRMAKGEQSDAPGRPTIRVRKSSLIEL